MRTPRQRLRGVRGGIAACSGTVHPAAAERLSSLLPAIKAEWDTLLRREPVLTPLGRPDTLVYLMDATLQQVLAGLREPARQRWLEACAPLAGSVHAACACGLNPLLNYFGTGELALAAHAAGALGKDWAEVRRVFRILARHEIEALCSVCRYRAAAEGAAAHAARG